MIDRLTINMPVCTLGAGVMHAGALAVLLPLAITLPAPGGGTAPGTVAIAVEIVAEPLAAEAPPIPSAAVAEEIPEPPVAEDDITAAIPVPASEPADPAPDTGGEEQETGAVAAVSPAPPLPERADRPEEVPSPVAAEPPPAKPQKAKPKPTRPASAKRARPKKGLFGLMKRRGRARPPRRTAGDEPSTGSWGAFLKRPY